MDSDLRINLCQIPEQTSQTPQTTDTSNSYCTDPPPNKHRLHVTMMRLEAQYHGGLSVRLYCLMRVQL